MRVKAYDPSKPENYVIAYYDNSRIRNGQVFKLKDPKDFREKWMVKIDDEAPTRTPSRRTPAKQVDAEVI